jgi:YidC/Oxa1 family membrane protein insertase
MSSKHLFAVFLAIVVIGVSGFSSNVLAAQCSEAPASGRSQEILSRDIYTAAQERFQKIEINYTTRRVLLPLSTVRTVEYATDLYGLASFYNTHWTLRLSSDASVIDPDDSDFSTQLQTNDWLGAVGRFNVLMLSAPGATPVLLPDGAVQLCYQYEPPEPIHLYFGDKVHAESMLPAFEALRFSHLWSGLAYLSWAVTIAIETIGKMLDGNWGFAILVFGLLLKTLLLPMNILTARLQRQVDQNQTALEPKIKSIKQRHDGEEAHNLIIASYKEQGITPFYTMKPMVGVLIQIPILIAVFNALAEMPQLRGASFLWIDDLASPDVIGNLPFAVPLLGDTINLLPLLMTAITIVSTWVFKNFHSTAKSLKDQKRNLYLMGGVFLVLFYPFPAAMVLYWTFANLLQFMQQEIVQLRGGT